MPVACPKAVTRKQPYAQPGWKSCTFAGAELSTLLPELQSPFREKLEWLEEAETLTLRLRASRKQAAKGRRPPSKLETAVTCAFCTFSRHFLPVIERQGQGVVQCLSDESSTTH